MYQEICENVKKTVYELDLERGWKFCDKCKLTKSLDSFILRENRNRFECPCKTCLNIRKNNKHKIFRLNNPLPDKKHIIDSKNGFKICEICNEQKDLQYFPFRIYKDIKIYSRQCQKCLNKIYKDKYYNKEKTLKIDIANNSKICNFCKNFKPLTEFCFVNGNRGNFYINKCNDCKKICKKCGSIREKRLDNKFLQCRKCLSDKQNERRNKDKEKTANKQNEYRNRPNVKLRQSKRRAERYNNDLNYRLRVNLRARIVDAIQDNKKCDTTMVLIGCSIMELKEYLSSKFSIGMNWENHGKGKESWHIDHVVPLALFDFSQESHQRAAFHFSNQQPLWENDNNTKNDIINGRRASLLSLEEKKTELIRLGFGHLFTQKLPENTNAV